MLSLKDKKERIESQASKNSTRTKSQQIARVFGYNYESTIADVTQTDMIGDHWARNVVQEGLTTKIIDRRTALWASEKSWSVY